MKTSQTEWVNVDIKRGHHEDREDGVCAMELVAWMAGEPHTDTPVCASTSITFMVQRWNDDLRSNDEREILRPVLPFVVNSRSKTEKCKVESLRVKLSYEWGIQQNLVSWLALVPQMRQIASDIVACNPYSKHLSELISAAFNTARTARSDYPELFQVARGLAHEAVMASGMDAMLGAAAFAKYKSNIYIPDRDIKEIAIKSAQITLCNSYIESKQKARLRGEVLEHTVQQLQQSGMHLLKEIADTAAMIAKLDATNNKGV